MRLPPFAILSLCALAFVGSATAHPVAGAAGLTAGFAHPLSGLDHVLAMVAVGLWAAQLGGRAIWRVPTAFVVMMLLGGALGAAGVGLPAVETGILGSVLLLGLLIAFGVRAPIGLSMAVAGGFALLHGPTAARCRRAPVCRTCSTSPPPRWCCTRSVSASA